jgi:glycerophosphoryl diester phosphodiesterase
MSIKLDDVYRDPHRVATTAHRGFSGRYPENTLPAFLAAVALGVDLLEFDWA